MPVERPASPSAFALTRSDVMTYELATRAVRCGVYAVDLCVAAQPSVERSLTRTKLLRLLTKFEKHCVTKFCSQNDGEDNGEDLADDSLACTVGACGGRCAI